ncbi:phospholipase-like protein [Tanacetum coccineum]
MINHTGGDKPFTPKPQPEDGELSFDEDLDVWLKTKMEKHMCMQDKENEEDTLVAILKSLVGECKAVYANKGAQIETSSDGTNELPPKELNPGSFALPCTIGSLNLYGMADLGASVNVMPKLIFEHLKLADLKETEMVVEMVDMMKKAPLGIVENILVKINKFLFPSDFVIIDMLGEPSETMILGRPFLVTIHAHIDVFNRKFSLGTGEDRVLFDMDRGVYHSKIPVEKCTRSCDNESIDTLDSVDNMLELEVKHEDMVQGPNLERIISRWHVCKPVRVFYDNECGKYCGMWPTCNLDLSFCSGYDAIYGKGENGMLEQWMCFRDHERQSVRGNRMIFADFLKVRYGNKSIDDTTRKRIRKKGYTLDDVWEKCEKYHGGTVYPWHDEGFEEEEQWESGIEKTYYKPPFVDSETFEIKSYSFKGGRIQALEQETRDLDVEHKQMKMLKAIYGAISPQELRRNQD